MVAERPDRRGREGSPLKRKPHAVPRIRTEPTALVFFAMLLLSGGASDGIPLVFAVLCHEAGHLIAARVLRVPVREIRLSFLGARIMTGGRLLSYGEEWLLAAAGPLFGLLCSIAACPLWGDFPGAVRFSEVSLFLSLLNLLPIRTFDGGRMLACFLEVYVPERVAGRIADACSFLLLFLLWCVSVYTVLRAGTGVFRLCFSMSVFSRFFDGPAWSANEKKRENERKEEKTRDKQVFL